MFNTLEEVLKKLVSEQRIKCNQIIKTDSNCNPASDIILLIKYEKAYNEYLQLISFYENFSNVEDDQFE